MQHLPAIFGRFKSEQRRSTQEKNANAPLHSAQIGESGSFDRQAQFSHLLARIQVYGVPYYEQEIDQIRTVDHLSESEREIVLEIFRFGYEAAEKELRQDKMVAYQRLLRRLLLHQPLDQPIPLRELPQEISRETTVHVAEPSVTQPSPKQGGASRRVRRRPGRWWLLKFAFYSIGAAALVWTAFVFRSPTNIRDAVVPVRDNQPDAARASAAQEDSFEPVAHARVLIPPTAIEPAAEGASASMAEPAPMGNAIVDQVTTSPKSPATAKLDTPVQAGKIKSASKVANQAANTVDASTGKKREREPAKDSLPIYQTQRRILLREEPRFGAPAQIMLDQGARLIVLEINGPWLKVKMENTGAPGFVREEFVAPVTTVPASVTSLNKG